MANLLSPKHMLVIDCVPHINRSGPTESKEASVPMVALWVSHDASAAFRYIK